MHSADRNPSRAAPPPRERVTPLAATTHEHQVLALQQTVGNHATGRILQRMKLREDQGTYVRDPDGSEDTLTMNRDQRRDLVAKLEKSDPKLLEEIQAEWRELSRPERQRKDATDMPLVDELITIAGTIGRIEKEAVSRKGYKQVAKASKNEMEALSKRLTVIFDDLLEGKGAVGDIGFGQVRELLARVATLTGEEAVAKHGLPPHAMEVTEADIEAYRQDTLEMGVWAGPSEAEALARAMNVSFDIFVISQGKYRLTCPNIGGGTGHRSSRSLLFLGNHYVVLRNADLKDGENAPEKLPVVAVTEARGDCLYEGIYILVNGHKPRDYETAIKGMRKQASVTMTPVAVETAITLIHSGARAGVGSRMQATLREAELRDLDAQLRVQEGYKAYAPQIDQAFKQYAAAEDEETKARHLETLQVTLNEASEELMPEDDERWVNPLSRPKTLYRYVSNEAGKDAVKSGIKFYEDGGGIPTSTKGGKDIATKSGAVTLHTLLVIDTSKIPDFKFEYVPTRSKIKEVKIKCDVPPEAITRK